MGGVIGIILLDETVVGVALPTMRRELGLSSVASHWVINAYLLVFAGFAAAGGKLGDIFGYRVPFMLSMAVFGLASLACGFAEGGAWLIAARAIQGIGAAMIFPLSIAMISVVFPPEQRGAALGIYGAIGTTFLALGPLVGGFFTDVLSWRWIFWINPPIVVAVALVILATWTDPLQEEAAATLDFHGLLTLVGGLGIFVFAVMQGPDWGWSNPAIVALLIGGAILLTLFALAERRAKAPLIEVDLFRNASFSVCNLAVFMAQFSKISVIVFGALYLQDVVGMSPLVAGLALLAAVGPVPILAAPSGRLTDRFGARPLVLWGLALTGAGLLWIGLTADSKSYGVLVAGLVVWGIGVTFLFAPPRSAIMNAVPPEKQGQAGGIAMTAQLLGATIGMALFGTLFTMTGSFTVVFLTNAGVALVFFVLAWIYVEGPDESGKARPQNAAPELGPGKDG